MDMDVLDCFSHRYAEARHKFMAAADAAGLDVHLEIHPLLGLDGETLALDVARSGPKDAEKLLLISSGCHGVEGYAGSGVQVALLRDGEFLESARSAGVALLFMHALNPWGMSWFRRVTHENIDLNRNFQDFHQPLPASPAYDALHSLLVSKSWPPSPENEAKLQAELQRSGLAALQQAVSGGQYSHPEGLFFGGHAPSWSQQALRHVLREYATHCLKLGWIDLHTGLGPTGVAEPIFAGDPRDAAQIARARAWWPGLTALHDGSSSSARLTGEMWHVIPQECPQAEYTGIGLEFGTVPPLHLLQVLRADQWLDNHPEKPLRTAQAEGIRQALFGGFFVDTPEWKSGLITQARAATLSTLTGLHDSKPLEHATHQPTTQGAIDVYKFDTIKEQEWAGRFDVYAWDNEKNNGHLLRDIKLEMIGSQSGGYEVKIIKGPDVIFYRHIAQSQEQAEIIVNYVVNAMNEAMRKNGVFDIRYSIQKNKSNTN